MNREKVIKAYECCYIATHDCTGCPFEKDKASCARLEDYVFNILTGLTQEKEELQEENKKLKADNLLFYQERVQIIEKFRELKIIVNSIYGAKK